MPEDVALEMGADVIISVDVITKNHLKKKPQNAIEVLLASINIMTKEIQKYKACHSDVLISPDTGSLSQMKFGKTTTMKAIQIGYKETLKYIEDIKKLLK